MASPPPTTAHTVAGVLEKDEGLTASLEKDEGLTASLEKDEGLTASLDVPVHKRRHVAVERPPTDPRPYLLSTAAEQLRLLGVFMDSQRRASATHSPGGRGEADVAPSESRAPFVPPSGSGGAQSPPNRGGSPIGPPCGDRAPIGLPCGGGGLCPPCGSGRAWLPIELMVRVLSVALATNAASADVVAAARAVEQQLVVLRPDSAAPMEALRLAVAAPVDAFRPGAAAPVETLPPDAALPKTPLWLGRLPTALREVVCDFLDQADVLNALIHVNRAARAFVCAPGSAALSTLCFARQPHPQLRFLAAGWRKRLRAVVIPPDVVDSAGTAADWWSARLGDLGTRVTTLNVCESVTLFRQNAQGAHVYTRVHISLPLPVWARLRELVLRVWGDDYKGRFAQSWAPLIVGTDSEKRSREMVLRTSSPEAVAAIAVRCNGRAVAHDQVGVVAPPPSHLPALQRLAFGGLAYSRIAAYLSTAARTSHALHSLALNTTWRAEYVDALVQLAPRLESFSLISVNKADVAVPPLPRVKYLHVQGVHIELAATTHPALESLIVDGGLFFTSASTDSPGWRTPRLRELTVTAHTTTLAVLLRAAPALESLQVILTTSDPKNYRQIGAVLAHCKQPSLRGIHFAAPATSRSYGPECPLVTTPSATKALKAALRLPRLERLTCGGVGPSVVDWSTAPAALRDVRWWSTTGGPKPSSAPPRLQWTSLQNAPCVERRVEHWRPFE